MTDIPFFDYEIMHTCQYPVWSSSHSDEVDCGEPAAYRAYWIYEAESDDEEDREEEMYLCEPHFNFVVAHEGGRQPAEAASEQGEGEE